MDKWSLRNNWLFLPFIFIIFLLLITIAFLSLASTKNIKFQSDIKFNTKGDPYKIIPKGKIEVDLRFLPQQNSHFYFHVACQSEKNCPDLKLYQESVILKHSWREKSGIFWIVELNKINVKSTLHLSNPSDQEVVLDYFSVANYTGHSLYPRLLITLSWPGRGNLSFIIIIIIILIALIFQASTLFYLRKYLKNFWRIWEFWVLLSILILFVLGWYALYLNSSFLIISWETFLILAALGPLSFWSSKAVTTCQSYLSSPVSQRFRNLLFLILVLVIILDRIKIIKDFLYVYADEDSALWWNGATEYAKGMFHEPRVFGQPYLTFIDSFFAVPLLWLGIPVDKALPVVASLFALTPFVILSLLAYRSKKYFWSSLILILPLTLPIEYNIISTLHGRETAYFVLSFTLPLLFLDKGKISHFIFGFLSIIAVSVCMDAILMVFPVVLYAIYKKKKTKSFFKWSSLGGLIGFIIHILAQSFYRLHPEYVLHGDPGSVYFTSPGINFSWSLFFKGISQLGMFWEYLVPIIHYHVWFLIGIFTVLIILLFRKKQYYLFVVSLISAGFFLYTLGMMKAYDGSTSVYFSYTRNYLGIPIFIGLMLYWVSESIVSTNINHGKKWMYMLLVFIIAINLGLKYNDYDTHSKKIFNTPGGLPGEHMSYIEKVCKAVEKVSENYHADLVIFPDGNRTLNYGCAAKLNRKINTLLAGYERRTWRIEEELNQPRGNFLIYGHGQTSAAEWERKTGKRAIQINQFPDIVLIESEPILVLPFLHKIGMPIRPTQLYSFYFHRGLLLEQSGNFTEALADYSRAIEKKPDFYQPFFHRGNIYLVSGNYKKAIEDYSLVLQINPLYKEAYLNRALAYEKIGSYRKAFSDLDQIKKLDPNDPKVLHYEILFNNKQKSLNKY